MSGDFRLNIDHWLSELLPTREIRDGRYLVR